MRWTTRNHLHLDRTASAWLIQRFIDPAAEFVFVDWDAAPDPQDPGHFGMPGVRLSGHDSGGTSFSKILTVHGLDADAALMQLERGIAAGVRHAVGKPATAGQTAAESAQGLALDQIGIGLSVLHNDLEHLEAAIPLYDALYAFLRLGDVTKLDLPDTQPERVKFLRDTLSAS
jgi:hypothetical protein